MSVVTGIFAVIFSIPIYLILFSFSPDFVENTWMYERLTGGNLLRIPIEDLIFYFVAGLFCGPFYYYATNQKIVDRK